MNFDFLFFKRLFIDYFKVPIHRDGYPYITLSVLGAFLLGLLWAGFLVVGLLLGLAFIYMFRNPKRIISDTASGVLAPADGKIELIETTTVPGAFGFRNKKTVRISIFTTPGDVHIVRAPVAGQIRETQGHFGVLPGEEEQDFPKECQYHVTSIEQEKGGEIGLVQISGPLDRMLLSRTQDGQNINAGDSLGLIRFFGRSDLYLPASAKVKMAVGQRCLAGETILADIAAPSSRQKDS